MAEEKLAQPEETELIQETPELVVEKKEKPWLKPLLFSILGIILAAGLVFAGYKLAQIRQVQPGPQPTPTPTPISTAVPSPTPEVSPRLTPTPSPKPITWKTYTNETYGFQIKYPAEMVLGPEPKAPDPELLSSKSIYRPEAANSIGKGHINVAVRSTPLDDLVASWEGLANRTAIQVKLDSLNAKKIEWVDTSRTDGINLYSQKILLAHNGLTYEVSLYVDNDGPKKNELLTIFSQMLSTFRFLE